MDGTRKSKVNRSGSHRTSKKARHAFFLHVVSGNAWLGDLKVITSTLAFSASERYRPATVYPTDHVWFGIRVNGEGSGQGKGGLSSLPHPHLSLYFWPSADPLVQITFFSPQPLAAIKIEDGGHNYCYENTEHSLAWKRLLCRLLQTDIRLSFFRGSTIVYCSAVGKWRR